MSILSQLPRDLRQPIHLRDAKAQGLRGAFGLEPDAADYERYVDTETKRRLDVLMEYLEIDKSDSRLAEKLVKALVEHEFGIPRDDPHWWDKTAGFLIRKYVPGFAIKSGNKSGAPRRWTFERLHRLWRDYEAIKRKHPNWNSTRICGKLPTLPEYRATWGESKPQALRKKLTLAKRLFAKAAMAPAS